MTALKASDFVRFQEYLDVLREKMRLRDWDVELKNDPPELQNASATIQALFEQKRAEVRLAPNFLELPLDRQRYVLVHELAHLGLELVYLGLEPLHERLSEFIEERVAPNEEEMVHGTFMCFLEHGVDWAAKVISEFMPAIPER